MRESRSSGRQGDPCAWDLDVAGREFVALDCETTGLDPLVDEPVTLGAVRVNGATGRRERFAAVLRPSRPVGASSAVHGFTDADLARCGRDPASALAELLAFIGRRPVVGHNIVNYDLPLLNANLARHGLPEIRTRVADTLWLARRAYSLDRYNLERVREACGVATVATHRAEDDAECSADCFLALAALLADTAPARRALLAAEQARFAPLARLVGGWRGRAPSSILSEPVEAILGESGYLDRLRRQGDEGRRRLATLQQIRALVIARFDRLPAERALHAFLEYPFRYRIPHWEGLEKLPILPLLDDNARCSSASGVGNDNEKTCLSFPNGENARSSRKVPYLNGYPSDSCFRSKPSRGFARFALGAGPACGMSTTVALVSASVRSSSKSSTIFCGP